MNALVTRGILQGLVILSAALMCAACATTGGAIEEGEPVAIEEPATPEEAAPDAAVVNDPDGGEVPLAVAETARPPVVSPDDEIEEVVVEAPRERHEVIRDLVSEASSRLRDVELRYVITKQGRHEVLRGRPVAFALWSESQREWTIAHIEIPRPPLKWQPGRKPFPFVVITPGIQARHVKGTGAERLMFAFSRDGEQLKVYGRKYPVFDDKLLAKKKWRAVVATAKPIVYLPFNQDTLDSQFVSDGTEFLLATARQAIEELRLANAPSVAYRGELLADVVPAEVLATLAVIEQTDDADFRSKKSVAFDEVLSQYGLNREEAYRYSVSRAGALGPMQFTNRKGKGTYSMVVKRCPEARLDPNFERGATNLLNAMKAAICLFDIELRQMRPEIRAAYHDNREVLGIFPVAAYNGGPRNVGKLHGVIKRMGVELGDLRSPGEQAEGMPVTCPCLWTEDASGIRPVAIPKYNNENRWYIEKYQAILGVFE
ncbi:MAG: lytic transglycosylase domain-containing protein [Steroidobacteraceae bacterium]|nr:lytic transglycosylase domain-containing protein [Steroidobacteraceae bacterium]